MTWIAAQTESCHLIDSHFESTWWECHNAILINATGEASMMMWWHYDSWYGDVRMLWHDAWYDDVWEGTCWHCENISAPAASGDCSGESQAGHHERAQLHHRVILLLHLLLILLKISLLISTSRWMAKIGNLLQSFLIKGFFKPRPPSKKIKVHICI